MTAGYDGSIRIDSSIDSKGFNAGMAKLRTSAGNALYEVRSRLAIFGQGVSDVIQRIEQIGRRLLIVGAIAVLAFGRMWRSLTESVSKTDAFYGTITRLQGAFDNLKGVFLAAFATLLTAALPAILTVINWLARMLTLISMIIAAFAGQKTIMVAVAGTGGEAADNAGKLASNTKKAKKEAQGALAAFDQINVLQKKNAEPQAETPSAGGAGGGTLQFQQVPIESKVLETVTKIKQWFADAWKWISDTATTAWKWIQQAWNDAGTFFRNIWKSVKTWAEDAWKWISDTWGKVSTWFMEHVFNPWWAAFSGFWGLVGILLNDAWATLVFLWGLAANWFKANVTDPLTLFFTQAWSAIKTRISEAWDKLVAIWAPFGAWLTAHVTDPLKSAFGTALEWVRTKWESIFSGLKSFVKGAFNDVLSVVNGLLSRITSGVNGIISSLNSFGGSVPGWIRIPAMPAVQVPYLAQGAIIPANAPFAAVLGDQRSGKNIEAPEALLRQIVRDEIGTMQVQSTIRFEGNLAALVRQLKPVLDQENVRVGKNVISSGASA